jgi:hypothetical protein
MRRAACDALTRDVGGARYRAAQPCLVGQVIRPALTSASTRRRCVACGVLVARFERGSNDPPCEVCRCDRRCPRRAGLAASSLRRSWLPIGAVRMRVEGPALRGLSLRSSMSPGGRTCCVVVAAFVASNWRGSNAARTTRPARFIVVIADAPGGPDLLRRRCGVHGFQSARFERGSNAGRTTRPARFIAAIPEAHERPDLLARDPAGRRVIR